MTRRGPLRVCGIATIEILGKVSAKTKVLNGPIGLTTERVFTIVTTLCPCVFALQDQWLAFLSYGDDRILAIENRVETLFPPSKHVFNNIDKLVYIAECLPAKFDDAMNKLPIILHQVPLLDWTFAYVIFWLNFFLNITLFLLGSKSTKRKGITNLDCSKETTKINPQNENVGTISKEVFGKESLFKAGKNFSDDVCERHSKNNFNMFSKLGAPQRRRSYKEILESGTKESSKVNRAKVIKTKGIPPTTRRRQEDESRRQEDESDMKSDLLQLFDSSWHLSPSRRRTMSAPMSV